MPTLPSYASFPSGPWDKPEKDDARPDEEEDPYADSEGHTAHLEDEIDEAAPSSPAGPDPKDIEQEVKKNIPPKPSPAAPPTTMSPEEMQQKVEEAKKNDRVEVDFDHENNRVTIIEKDDKGEEISRQSFFYYKGEYRLKSFEVHQRGPGFKVTDRANYRYNKRGLRSVSVSRDVEDGGVVEGTRILENGNIEKGDFRAVYKDGDIVYEPMDGTFVVYDPGLEKLKSIALGAADLAVDYVEEKINNALRIASVGYNVGAAIIQIVQEEAARQQTAEEHNKLVIEDLKQQLAQSRVDTSGSGISGFVNRSFRWLWTGSRGATDEQFDDALVAGGDNVIDNLPAAYTALDTIGIVDPTILSSVVKASLMAAAEDEGWKFELAASLPFARWRGAVKGPKAGIAKGANVGSGRTGRLLSDADLLKARIGPAHVSHAEEYASILRQLRDAGVDIEFRRGSLAYSPARGGPGRIILDPDASIGAVRHEFRHFLDIRDAGFPGLGPFYTNSRSFARLEVRGYLEEFRLARELGHHDLVPQIVQQMRQRVRELLGR